MQLLQSHGDCAFAIQALIVVRSYGTCKHDQGWKGGRKYKGDKKQNNSRLHKFKHETLQGAT